MEFTHHKVPREADTDSYYNTGYYMHFAQPGYAIHKKEIQQNHCHGYKKSYNSHCQQSKTAQDIHEPVTSLHKTQQNSSKKKYKSCIRNRDSGNMEKQQIAA